MLFHRHCLKRCSYIFGDGLVVGGHLFSIDSVRLQWHGVRIGIDYQYVLIIIPLIVGMNM